MKKNTILHFFLISSFLFLAINTFANAKPTKKWKCTVGKQSATSIIKKIAKKKALRACNQSSDYDAYSAGPGGTKPTFTYTQCIDNGCVKI